MRLSPCERELLGIVARLLAPAQAPDARPCLPELAELLRRHHLRPLAHADGVQNLEEATQQCALIAAFHRRTLEQVGSALKEAGIRWTTIKGAAYAWDLYDVPEHRPMSDLDLLVRDFEFERACETLTSVGFVERSVSVRTRHAQTFTRSSHEIVDLHRDILQPLRGAQGMPQAWKRARPGPSLPGYWQLDLVDVCWIHIAHMARHEFIVPLVSYVDLQRLLRTLSMEQKARLDAELVRMRLDYAFVVAMQVISALLNGRLDVDNPRTRLIIPSLKELLAGRHRGRSAQILKKLALFPRDTLALGVGWALRSAEDKLIRYRAK